MTDTLLSNAQHVVNLHIPRYGWTQPEMRAGWVQSFCESGVDGLGRLCKLYYLIHS